MTRREILVKLNSIFRNIFDEIDFEISESTTMDDIEDWDSIEHVYLTVEIEDQFGILLGEKMQEIESVSDIIDLIESKI